MIERYYIAERRLKFESIVLDKTECFFYHNRKESMNYIKTKDCQTHTKKQIYLHEIKNKNYLG